MNQEPPNKADFSEYRRYISSTPNHKRNLQYKDEYLVRAYENGEYEEYDVTNRAKNRVLRTYRLYCKRAIDNILFITDCWKDIPIDGKEGKTQMEKIFDDPNKCLKLIKIMLMANIENDKLKLQTIAILNKIWNLKLAKDSISPEPEKKLIEITATFRTDLPIFLESVEEIVGQIDDTDNFDLI